MIASAVVGTTVGGPLVPSSATDRRKPVVGGSAASSSGLSRVSEIERRDGAAPDYARRLIRFPHAHA